MANRTGSRLVCITRGVTVIVTHGGDGELTCCGRPLQRPDSGAETVPAAQRVEPGRQ